MIVLKDANYESNKVEIRSKIINHVYDGEVNKFVIMFIFEFGIQCMQEVGTIYKENKQSIVNQILWTQDDINELYNQIKKACNKSDSCCAWITLVEPEFEALIINGGSTHVISDYITIFITIGKGGAGSSIKLTTKKIDLIKWVESIRELTISA